MQSMFFLSVFASLAAAGDDVKLPKLLATEPPKPAATDTELQKKIKERFAEVHKEMTTHFQLVQAGQGEGGQGGVNAIVGTANRFLDSYLALEPTPAENLDMLANYVDYIKEIERQYKARFEAGALRGVDMNRITWYRLDAEIKLLKAKDAK